MIKAIFLDFDGTVSDARLISLRSFSKTLEDFGYSVDEKKIADLLGTKLKEMLSSVGVRGIDVEKARNRFYKYFTAAALAGGIRPCVSLKPLWKLKSEGFPLIIISNSRTSFLRASIKTLEIKGLFDKIYGGDKFGRKDELLGVLFKKMKISPEEAVYIGDRFSDVEYARKAGCFAIAIHNKCSFSTLARIKKEKPDFIVRDFYGLSKAIRELNKN